MKNTDCNWILVTGAAGFIGYHVVEALLKQGYKVVGIDNLDPFYDVEIKRKNVADLVRISSEHFKFIEMDICDDLEVSLSSYSFDGVIHLAARAGVRPSIERANEYVEGNVGGTTNLLEFTKNTKIEKFVFASSSSVYGDDTPAPFMENAVTDSPISPYAVTKRACELMIQTYAHLFQLRCFSLRLFTVYGPRQRPDLAISKFTSSIIEGKPVTIYGNGESSRDYTHVTDIANGILLAFNKLSSAASGCHEIMNIGSAQPVMLSKLLEIIESFCPNNAEKVHLPCQMGDVQSTYACIQKAKEIIDYSPQVTIEKGLRDFVAWKMSRGSSATYRSSSDKQL